MDLLDLDGSPGSERLFLFEGVGVGSVLASYWGLKALARSCFYISNDTGTYISSYFATASPDARSDVCGFGASSLALEL